jgi:hypothetical protein
MAETNHDTARNASPSNLYSFDDWLRGRNLTRTTGFRYRKKGLIQTLNIFGRLYITADEIRRFEARAIAGDFSQAAKTPKRHSAKEADA